VSYTLLSVLLRTWNVSCLILCNRCYRRLGGLVVLYFALSVMEDLEGSFRILCDRCYSGLGKIGVLFFVICVLEDLER
jgi:hypothetical protein